MESREYQVIKSGRFYLTYLDGYSSNIDMAMPVRPDIHLKGKQCLVKVRLTTTVEEVS